MLAKCLETAVASAASSGNSVGTVETVLLEGLNACAAASSSCIQSAMASASQAGSSGAAALASTIAACELQPTTPEPCSSLEVVVLSSRVWVSRMWSFLGFYNAVQLVVMPWVFLWIFSGTVVGVVRFVKFQYQLVCIGLDVLVMTVLFLLISIEDLVSVVVNIVYARFRRSFREQRLLESKLRLAKTFAEHKEAHLALSDFLMREPRCHCRGRRKPERATSQEESEQIKWLSDALNRVASGKYSRVVDDLATLEPLIVREAGGIDWLGGAQGEQLLQKLSSCLLSVCEAQEKSNDLAEKADMLAWLRARQKALGITALCLSGGGSLAMIHMGVCRFLLEEGLMPEVVSGVSGGAIVAAFLAIHTDEELLQHVLVPSVVVRHQRRWFPPLWQEILNFIRIGVLVPSSYFEQTCNAYYGTWTFEEAYARTGREVSIVISSNFSEKLPACIMLNHMTAPRVTIASAVATSCAAVGIMKPRGLIVKDAITGELKPFEILGKSFADGTFVAEVPKDYLRSFYGATQFLVSQVNPHVSAFLGNKENPFQALRSYFGKDLQNRARLLSEYRLLPSFFGRAMCKATKHLSQDFGGPAPDGITVFPPNMGLAGVKAAVSNPTTRDMEDYILQGQHMAWKKAGEIRARMHVEVTIAKLIHRLQEPRSPTVMACPHQPPPIPSVRRNSSGILRPSLRRSSTGNAD